MTDTETGNVCPHPDFEAQVTVTRLADSGLFALDLKVWCKACALPFEFPDAIPIGIDLGGIARSVSGQELRVAIRPATRPDDWADHDYRPHAGPRTSGGAS